MIVTEIEYGRHTYGGNGDENAAFVSVDNSGNVCLAGETSSSAGIAFGGFQNSLGGLRDAFLVKFNSAGNRIWGTYYGGSQHEDAEDVTTDRQGNVYLVGGTRSPTGMAFSGFQNSLSSQDDAFIVKFDSNGSRIWGSYYGGTKPERRSAIHRLDAEESQKSIGAITSISRKVIADLLLKA